MKLESNNKVNVGVGLRSGLLKDKDELLKIVDFFEINTGSWLSSEAIKNFGEISKHVPVVPHSLDLSVGSAETFDSEALAVARSVTNEIKPAWFSEHLSFNRLGDIKLDSFVPMPYIEESVELLKGKVKELASTLKTPIILENVTADFRWAINEFSEVEFLNKVVEQCDCGLLLDVTNLYINSLSHHYDAYEFLGGLDPERIVEVHIAGHSVTPDGRIVDSHVGDIHPEVTELLRWVLKNTSCKTVLLERDTDFEDYHDLMNDLNLVRDVCNQI